MDSIDLALLIWLVLYLWIYDLEICFSAIQPLFARLALFKKCM